LTRFATDLNSYSGILWEWFISSPLNGSTPLNYLLGSFKRHGSSLIESVVSVLCEYGKYNICELFTYYIPMVCQNETPKTISSFIAPISQHKKFKDQIIEAGVIKYLLESTYNRIDNENNSGQKIKAEDRAGAVDLFSELWEYFPNEVEKIEGATDNILKIVQRSSRDKNEALQLFVASKMFHLLEVFTQNKNPFATVIYKSLTFMLVENHQRESVRALILENFGRTIIEQKGIPVQIIAEPYIKLVFFIILIIK